MINSDPDCQNVAEIESNADITSVKTTEDSSEEVPSVEAVQTCAMTETESQYRIR